MRFPILLFPPALAVLGGVLLLVSRGFLVLMACHHFPLLMPALVSSLENSVGYRQLSPLELQRLMFALVLVPEAVAWAVRRFCRVTARLEGSTLVLEPRRGAVRVIALAGLAAVTPWPLRLPTAGFWLPTGEKDEPALAVGCRDPAAFLEALHDAGAPAESVAAALRRPAVRLASARHRARGWLDNVVVKFVVFPLLLAAPVFRLWQWLQFGGTFGEYYEHGLKAYLLGFGLYWLLAAFYMLFVAAGLRAVGEILATVAAWTLSGGDLALRRFLEVLHRLLYYGAPSALLYARLVFG